MYPKMDLYLIGQKLGYELVNDTRGRQKLSTQISNLLNKSSFIEQQNLLSSLDFVFISKCM